MFDPHGLDIALAAFGLLVAFGSAGLARFALTRLERDEAAEMARIDRDFIARLPEMSQGRPRPVRTY